MKLSSERHQPSRGEGTRCRSAALMFLVFVMCAQTVRGGPEVVFSIPNARLWLAERIGVPLERCMAATKVRGRFRVYLTRKHGVFVQSLDRSPTSLFCAELMSFEADSLPLESQVLLVETYDVPDVSTEPAVLDRDYWQRAVSPQAFSGCSGYFDCGAGEVCLGVGFGSRDGGICVDYLAAIRVSRSNLPTPTDSGVGLGGKTKR